MQDKTSIRITFKGKRTVFDLLDEEGIKVIDWSARSPDLTPIENMVNVRSIEEQGDR